MVVRYCRCAGTVDKKEEGSFYIAQFPGRPVHSDTRASRLKKPVSDKSLA